MASDILRALLPRIRCKVQRSRPLLEYIPSIIGGSIQITICSTVQQVDAVSGLLFRCAGFLDVGKDVRNTSTRRSCTERCPGMNARNRPLRFSCSPERDRYTFAAVVADTCLPWR